MRSQELRSYRELKRLQLVSEGGVGPRELGVPPYTAGRDKLPSGKVEGGEAVYYYAVRGASSA